LTLYSEKENRDYDLLSDNAEARDKKFLLEYSKIADDINHREKLILKMKIY
jgi:hypothetical protein